MKSESKEFEFVKKCPVCNSENATKVMPVRDMAFNCKESFPLVRCSDCDHLYLQKRPTKQNISKYYPDVYEPYNISKHDFYVELHDVLSHSYFEQNKTLIDYIYGFLYSCVYGYFPSPSKKNRRVLDIGCGNGVFIKSLEKNGWDVYGIDMSTKSVDFATKVLKLKNVVQGDIEKNDYTDKFYDVIVMNHVIEHVYDPRVLLQKASNALKDNGEIIITTPNSNALNFRLFNNNWFPLETPRHLTLFNRNSMTKLAEISGLRIKQTFYDRSSHAMINSIKYRFELRSPLLKLLLIPITIGFSLAKKSDIVTYYLVKNTIPKQTND